MKSISASKAILYEACPRQFYFTYILKLLQLDNQNLLLGNAYHNSIEAYHNDKESVLSQKDFESFSPVLRYFPLKTQKEQRDKVYNYFSRYILNEVETTGSFECEKKFSINIPGLDVPFVGKIDRLDEDKIVEYKTSSFKYKEEHAKALQSLSYCYVVWRLFGKNLPIVYSVVNKNTKLPAQELRVAYTEDELSLFPERIINIYNKIVNKEFDQVSGIHCRWCPYSETGTNNCL